MLNSASQANSKQAGARMIPKPVATIVGEVLGSYYYSHSQLNSLFWESGAKGDPPPGNCCKKVRDWLLRLSDSPDDLNILGELLQDFMEVDHSWKNQDGQQTQGRERIRNIMAQYGLSYQVGGRIIGANVASPTRSLETILHSRDLKGLNDEFDRAIENVEKDPPASLTAACAILESLCRIYIENERLPMPSKETLKPLWSVVQKDLKLDPGAVEDQDIARILSGLTSIVDGIASLRTHAGSAHGHGNPKYRIASRHARLTIHAAHTMATFILETWEFRKKNHVE
jgi:hypothetical protein